MNTTFILVKDIFRPQHRLGVLLYILLIPLLFVLLKSHEHWWSEYFLINTNLYYLPLLLSFFYFSMVFSYADFSGKAFETGFPKYLYLLPVHSRKLASIPLLTSATFLTFYYLIYCQLILIPFGLEPATLLVIITMIAIQWWVQAIGWAFGHRQFAGIILLLIVINSLIVSAFILKAPPQVFTDNARLIAKLSFAFFIPSGLLLAVVAVKKDRYNDKIMPAKKNYNLLLPGFKIKQAFSNGFRAQVWYEFRLFGYILPAIVIGIAVLFSALMLIQGDDPYKSTTAIMVITLLMFFMAASVIGLEMAKPSFGNSELTLSNFMATRPLSDARYVYAKLIVALGSLLSAWLIIVVIDTYIIAFSPLSEFFMPFWQQFIDGLNSKNSLASYLLSITLPAALAWVFCGNNLSIALLGNKVILLVATFVTIFVLIFFFGSSVWFHKHPEHWQILKPLLPSFGIFVSVILLVIGAIFIFWLTKKNKIEKDLLRTLVAFMTGIYLVFWLLTAFSFPQIALQVQTVISLLMLAFYCCLPFLTAPLSFARSRRK